MPPTAKGFTADDVREHIRQGALRLDKIYPQWFQHQFDWHHFNIASPFNCLLGQLRNSEAPWRNYSEAADKICAGENESYFGFCNVSLADTEVPVSDLYRDAWKAEVQKRLEKGTEPKGLALNETEKGLLISLLTLHEAELDAEIAKLKPQYRQFLNPQKMTAHALLVTIKEA